MKAFPLARTMIALISVLVVACSCKDEKTQDQDAYEVTKGTSRNGPASAWRIRFPDGVDCVVVRNNAVDCDWSRRKDPEVE